MTLSYSWFAYFYWRKWRLTGSYSLGYSPSPRLLRASTGDAIGGAGCGARGLASSAAPGRPRGSARDTTIRCQEPAGRRRFRSLASAAREPVRTSVTPRTKTPREAPNGAPVRVMDRRPKGTGPAARRPRGAAIRTKASQPALHRPHLLRARPCCQGPARSAGRRARCAQQSESERRCGSDGETCSERDAEAAPGARARRVRTDARRLAMCNCLEFCARPALPPAGACKAMRGDASRASCTGGACRTFAARECLDEQDSRRRMRSSRRATKATPCASGSRRWPNRSARPTRRRTAGGCAIVRLPLHLTPLAFAAKAGDPVTSRCVLDPRFQRGGQRKPLAG